MKLYDVSRPLYPRMPVYPGDPEFERTTLTSEDSFISAISLGTHTGTHIDAPAHYFFGADGIDKVPLESFIGPAEVCQYPEFSKTAKTVLFKGTEPLSTALAEKLIEAGVTAVGCDTDSIGDSKVHRLLLKKGIAIIECLDLQEVAPGRYYMAALPLKITDGDAAPARVVLMKKEETSGPVRAP